MKYYQFDIREEQVKLGIDNGNLYICFSEISAIIALNEIILDDKHKQIRTSSIQMSLKNEYDNVKAYIETNK
ncbi:hypothetical protein CTM93_03240 [Photobacterium phosphoreum]|jgi:regulator of RNase E activity RraB|uniref:hypothetical protein n=1 Tax=Photobacterium phosphoreum TaxID=659 RepID=UPI000D17ED70|nr:hypothetical protein [Photobacterium phosphoreum]PSU85490.1 hypothetical protein CTM93_03240 [Photobacterium phosphoreum]